MNLKGFSYPLSVNGTANLVPTPPWYYTCTALFVEYWTTPENVRAFLPDGVEPNEETGPRVSAQFLEWQYATKDGKEYLDPVRSQYSEFMVWIDGKFKGKPVAFCPAIYVTADNSMARGWIQGLPKRLASIYITRAYNTQSPATPVLGPGGEFGASVSLYGRRLADCHVKLEKKETDIAAAVGSPVINMRHFPRLQKANYDKPAVHELVMSGPGNAMQGSNFWVGTGEINYYDVPGNEIQLLKPVRYGRGWRGNLALTLDDQDVVLDYTKG